jgi:chromosome segregation ATPase
LRELTEIGQLSPTIDSMKLTISSKTSTMDSLTQELALAKEETGRLTLALECLKNETQSREQDAANETQQLTATVEELQGWLATEQTSKEALSRELEVAQLREIEIQEMLERVRDEAQLAVEETQQLSSTVASLQQELNKEQSSYSEAISKAQVDFDGEVSKLQAQIDESRTQCLSLQAEHANAVQDRTTKLGKAKSQLAKAREGVACHESLEHDLHQMKSAHADELSVLRTCLTQSLALSDSLEAQVQTARETMKDFESGIEASAGRYDAAQVEIHSLEQALAAARTHVEEHDASIQALQRDENALEIEHMRLGAECDRLATKFQYAEQQVKRRYVWHDFVA